MRRRAFLVSGALLTAFGLALAPSWSEQKQPAPAKTTVEVTYYYLPG